MDRARILLAGTPNAVLSDIVRQVASHRSDMEVVGHGVQSSELTDRAVATRANVVVLRLEDFDLPSVCVDLLNVVPGVVVVGLISDGRRVLLLADTLGADELMTTIQAARGTLADVKGTDGRP